MFWTTLGIEYNIIQIHIGIIYESVTSSIIHLESKSTLKVERNLFYEMVFNSHSEQINITNY